MDTSHMLAYPDEKLGLFIDAANFDATLGALGWDVDYVALAEHFSKLGRLMAARYYTALDAASPRKFVDWLAYHGYQVTTKINKEIVDSRTGALIRKGNMDIEISVDMLTLAPGLDHIVLVSGDGDFTYVVKALQQMAKRVSIVSTMDLKVTASDLIKQADNFIEINSLREAVQREPRPSVRAAVGMATSS